MTGKKPILLVWVCSAGSVLLLLASGMLSANAGPGKVKPTGEQIFRLRCASCHGAKGEGTKHYPKPLTGSQSVGQLARFIAQSMPPGPKKCTGEDAKRVAAYLYDAFYSPLAQARHRPARIALSRLTVRQFRNVVADLVSSFRPAPPQDAQRGLRGEYFKSRDFEDKERVLERVDPEVTFDFGTAGPIPDKFDPHKFSIRWQGSVLAPDTGEYEFIVRTEHSAALWVNDEKKPLIDAWVKSGSDTEFRASLTLVGGRVYPLRLEFSKSSQGVDDSDKIKGKPAPKASVALLWKRPHQTDEVIPARCLFPASVPETFVTTAPFPPDDRSVGYERGNSVSKAWDEATTSAALETAAYIAAHLRDLSGVADDAKDRNERIRAFCKKFVERAFRRPLTGEQEAFYIARRFEGAPDLETAVKRVVLLTLKSPRFLYREIDAARPDAYDLASRLSFALWDSLPDETLLKAAASGELGTREQVARQAARMVADPRAWFKLREFFLQWLKVDHYPELAKDAKRFPDFNAAAAADLRTSLELFLEKTVWNERADYRELLLSDKLYLNGRLAKLYGASLPSEAPFQEITAASGERSGVLTQPYLMASFAYLDTSSPIHRGVLLARNLLGRTLAPPAAAFVPLPASKYPNLTTRQRVELQTKPAACASCHGMINALGFTLEKYDAIGRVRSDENGLPIDTTGRYQPKTGQAVKFSDVRDLARYLAGSEEAHTAFVERLFQYLVKQPIRAYGPQTLPGLQRAFEGQACNIRKLMVEIATQSALTRKQNT